MEKDAHIRQDSWGGYIRCNKLFRRVFDREGMLLEEQFLYENNAIMMYSPFLPER
jgi:vancomycin resistance protein VanW